MKQVIYTGNPNFYNYTTLTKGRVYNVVHTFTTGGRRGDTTYYCIVNDRGDRYAYRSSLFKETGEELDNTIAELEQKLEDLRAERARKTHKNIFYRAMLDPDFESNIDTALASFSDVITSTIHLPDGFALDLYNRGNEETTGIYLDPDYDWSIVKSDLGHSILICKER